MWDGLGRPLSGAINSQQKRAMGVCGDTRKGWTAMGVYWLGAAVGVGMGTGAGVGGVKAAAGHGGDERCQPRRWAARWHRVLCDSLLIDFGAKM